MEEDVLYYEKFLNGDITAFETLVIKYKNQLIYFIMRYIADFHIAEDLAQDVFVDIYVHKERYNRTLNFKTYLFTIGRNKAIDHIRKHKLEYIGSADEFSQEEYYELEQLVLKEEERKLVRETMYLLKKEYEMAILLIDFYDLSYKDASRILGKTLPQMKVLIHRARKALGKLLLKEGYSYEKW